MNPGQEEFLKQTSWLRPFTRWAAAFSIHTQGWLPEVVRNAPLKLVKRVLQKYQKDINGSCNSCR